MLIEKYQPGYMSNMRQQDNWNFKRFQVGNLIESIESELSPW